MPESTAPRPDEMRPDDVPLDLVNEFRRAEVMAAGEEDDPVRAFLAHFLPATYRHWFAKAFGTPEEIASRQAEPLTEDDTVRLCEMARPGEHARRVRAEVAAETKRDRSDRLNRLIALIEEFEQLPGDVSVPVSVIREAMEGRR